MTTELDPDREAGTAAQTQRYYGPRWEGAAGHSSRSAGPMASAGAARTTRTEDLEYDRGTEPARKYAAKFRAYYRYRDSGQAARDYVGFPSLLFVTTDPSAEHRIAEQAHCAWFIRGIEPLTVLITTTDRIGTDGEGVLGRIWRRAPVVGSRRHVDFEPWPPEEAATPLVDCVGQDRNDIICRDRITGSKHSTDSISTYDCGADPCSMTKPAGRVQEEGINCAE